ncbi:MAG TPA: hypothetical protein VGO46_03920 [Gemmatimonadaceae bacterium]|nr:hypothetical protein [Gemmatimonadaceae bacterium]
MPIVSVGRRTPALTTKRNDEVIGSANADAGVENPIVFFGSVLQLGG